MRICFGWTVWCLAVVFSAQAQDVPLRETPQGKLFGPEAFAVRLDAQTGWPRDVLCDGRTIVKAADTRQVFDLLQDTKWVTGDGSKIRGLGVERLGTDTLKSRMTVGDWSVDAFLQIFPEKRMLRRWFEITWQGAADTKVKGFWIQGGVLPIRGNGGYFCPVRYPPRRIGAQELVEGRKAYGRHGLIGETGDGWSAVWRTDGLPAYADRSSVGAAEQAGQIRVTQSFEMRGRLRKGVTQKVGDAWLWLQPNDGETALRRMSEWFRLVGQVPPEDRPEWLKRVILYSFHPGGTIGSNCQDLGGFKAATAFLPHIADLGCNAIWLMPLEDQSIYCPRDYYKFQEGLGTPEAYKALTAKAHELGMRVWQDCVPHGGRNNCPRAQAHPEWLVQNEDGTTLPYWCFDFNWPAWVDYMANVASFYTREYGLDGFRIDAVGGSHIPNWNPAIPYARASLSQSQGGFAMQRAIRGAVRAVRPDGAILAEVGEDVFGATSDAVYDFDLCYSVLHNYRRDTPEVFVPRLRRWLHEQAYAEVPDLVRMRHIESHDSLRSGLWYGADAQRALVALTSWIHGIPLVYHEMEDGNDDAYRRIFHMRHAVAELNAGSTDYLSVTAPDGVFACLRTGQLPVTASTAWSDDYAWDTAPKGSERASIALVNLSGKPVRGTVSVPAAALPEALRDARWVRDLMRGEKIAVRQGVMDVSLPPFGYTVLRFGSMALPKLPAMRNVVAKDEGAVPSVSSVALLKIKAKSGTLLIDSATGLATAWQAGGRVLAADMDLALPAELAQGATNGVCRQKEDGAVELTRRFGERVLTVRYEKAGDGVAVRAAWHGGVPTDAAILVSVPQAERWFACTAEGVFESPFRVRHPGFDGSVGSIYRLPQGTATVWDSLVHPFGLSAAAAQVGAERDGRRVAFGFAPEQFPAAVRILDRIGTVHGMRVALAWRSEEDGVARGGDVLVFSLRSEKTDTAVLQAGTGDARLTEAGGGWEYENAHYRARVSRSGVLMGLWRKEGTVWRQTVRQSRLYTDKGFEGDKDFAQENDVEACARIERCGEAVKLSFSGALRGFQRFDKMARPIRFYSAYVFGNGSAFRRTLAFDVTAGSAADVAFLSLITNTEGAERVAFADKAGAFLTGVRDDGKARFAQTAKSQEPGRLPCEIHILDAAGDSVLSLDDVTWLGRKPANVFMHGTDLHLAWMDGKPDNGRVGQWSGVSMSVACAKEAAVAAPEPLPLVRDGGSGLLRDGDFEKAGGAVVTLLRTGILLPQSEKGSRTAWQLPQGAKSVEADGNRYLTIEGDGQSYRLIRQVLAVEAFPMGSSWRLTARMKGVSVARGDAGWETACLRWAVQTSKRGEYFTASLPFGDSEWREVSVEMSVPTGVRGVSVEAGMNGNAGAVWIDDVRIEEIKKPSL